ncbi:MAG: adenosylhomocysteine nucleosidase [Verrucomicrobiota bacterium]
MIAITFALPTESSSLRRELPRKIDNHGVAIFHTGVGRERCERTIEHFLQTATPRLLISSGFAGAVDDVLNVGDLVVAQNFSDASLAARVRDRARAITLFTADAMVDSNEERNEIAREFGAAAVDMETEVIARACAARSIPMLSLRVISDTPREPFPAPPSVLFDIARQRTNYAGLLSYLLRRPTRVFDLARFANQIARARNVLTNALVDLVREL